MIKKYAASNHTAIGSESARNLAFLQRLTAKIHKRLALFCIEDFGDSLCADGMIFGDRNL
jgi:hypothetical protein